MIKKIYQRVWNSPTILTWGNMLSTSLKLLLLTPLILVKYNIHEIAFWYLLLTINSFVLVVDFGFYPTFSRVVSYAFNGLQSLADVESGQHKGDGKPNWDLMKRLYGTINYTYLIISFIVLIVIFGFTYFPFKNVIEKTSEHGQLWIAYYLYISSVFVAFFSRKFDAVIIGTNNIVLINRWDIINNLLVTITSLLAVYFNLQLYWLAAIQLLFSLLLVSRDYYLERIICDGNFKKFKFFSFDKEIFNWCWQPTWRSGVLILCSAGINQATGLIYSNVSDAAQLAAYLLTLKLITTISQFSQAPFYSKLPIFTGLRIKNSLNELTETTATSMRKSLWIYSIGACSLILIGNWCLHLIGSKAALVNSNVLILIALVLFLERQHAMHAQIVVTTNKVPFYKSAIVSGIVNILIVIFFLPRIGVWAFPLGQGISNLLINNWWNVKLSIESLNVKFTYYFMKTAAIPLLLLIIVSIIKLFL